MGFWSWLLGYGKGDEPEIEIEEASNVKVEAENKGPEVIKKPKYKPRAITREDALFVKEMDNKAKNPDLKITPFVDKTDPKYIEKIADKIKDKIAKKR